MKPRLGSAYIRAALGAVLSLALGGIGPTPLVAQDSHYWSEQYGTRATLLGGAMIGSTRDLSATYYNPGAIALEQESLGFILSARAYRRGTLILEDGAGAGVDLSSSAQKPIPTLLAVEIDFDWLGDHRIAYSVLTRQQFDATVGYNSIDQRDVFSAPGDEDVAGAYVGSSNMREIWTGLSWAYPVTERIGIGVTQFLAARQRSIGSSLLAQAATQADEVAIAVVLRERSYSHTRIFTKFGVAWESGPVTLGLNATTPSIGISGDGSATYNASLAGIDQTGDGSIDNYLASDIQTGLPSTYETSWIVGAGGAVQAGDFRVHLSAEWFDSIDPHIITNAADIVPQAGSGVIVNDLAGELASVLNWGVGLEYGVGTNLSVYAGLASDNSAASPGSRVDADPVVTKYDLMRYSVGASFTVRNTQLMLGIGYAGGVQDFPRLIDLDNLGTNQSVFDGTETVDLRLEQWTFVLGFELGIDLPL